MVNARIYIESLAGTYKGPKGFIKGFGWLRAQGVAKGQNSGAG